MIKSLIEVFQFLMDSLVKDSKSVFILFLIAVNGLLVYYVNLRTMHYEKKIEAYDIRHEKNITDRLADWNFYNAKLDSLKDNYNISSKKRG